MLVGGGNSSTNYVAACIYDTSEQYNCREVATARGINAESLQYHTLNLSNYLGQTVFFKVVDNNTGEWGHVTLDDVRANIPAIPTGVQVTHDTYGASLSWQADSESGVAGYNVYRSTTPNSNLIKLNSSLVTRVSYRDASAQPGTAYYYYVTTVGTDNIESEKSNTYTRAVEDLYTRGSTTTYSGNTLTQIEFPVGPIGAGGILHFDTAARNEGWIMNNGNYQDRYSGIVPNSFFAVRAQPQGGSAVVRALQTTPVGAFPAMSALTFQGEYPLATYNFQDSSLPIAVSELVDNPMIPGNLKNSAIPTAIYTLNFTNTSQNQVSVSLLASQQNAVGYDGSSAMGGTNNRNFSGYGSNTNSLAFDSNGGHLQMGGSNGSMTLSMLGSQTTGTASWDTLSNLEFRLRC